MPRDPTRTLTLRRDYARAHRARWRKAGAVLRRTIVERDAFRLTGEPNPLTGLQEPGEPEPATDFGPGPPESQVERYDEWLEDTLLLLFFGTLARVPRNLDWQMVFLRHSYSAALRQANGELRRAGLPPPDDFDPALLLRQPLHRRALALEGGQNVRELLGILEEIRRQATREAVEALRRTASPTELDVALQLAIRDGIARTNALAVSRIVGIHAEATLNRFMQAGIEEVVVEEELVFTTAGDARVCQVCRDLAGERFTIRAARGVIPLHVGCRCRFRVAAASSAAEAA